MLDGLDVHLAGKRLAAESETIQCDLVRNGLFQVTKNQRDIFVEPTGGHARDKLTPFSPLEVGLSL